MGGRGGDAAALEGMRGLGGAMGKDGEREADDEAVSSGRGGGGFGGGDEYIPPQIEAMFSDQATMEKRFRSGFSIDKSRMDEVDAFLAQFYEMSSKAPSGTAVVAYDTNARRRTQLPKARSLHQLLQHLKPNIDSVDPNASPAAKIGHNLGEQVWDVLSDNLYYSDADKRYMANLAAHLGTRHLAAADKIAAAAALRVTAQGGDLYNGLEMIFTEEFKKGKTGMDEEKRRRAAANFIVPDDYKQGETNWTQKAVIDEDQL